MSHLFSDRYFSTLFNGQEATTRSRIEVITNVVPTTVRSTISPEPSPTASSLTHEIEPTAVIGRRAPKASKILTPHAEDLNEVGSHLSETSETTLAGSSSGPEVTTEPNMDYYELESSEMTTERSLYNEHEQLVEHHGDDGGSDVVATPALKTLFTTFSFFTTYYKGGTSTVSTRLQTITNIVSDVVNDGTSTESPESQLPVFPITYLTTVSFITGFVIHVLTIL